MSYDPGRREGPFLRGREGRSSGIETVSPPELPYPIDSRGRNDVHCHREIRRKIGKGEAAVEIEGLRDRIDLPDDALPRVFNERALATLPGVSRAARVRKDE